MKFFSFVRAFVAFLMIVTTFAPSVFAQADDRDVLRDRIDMLLSTQEATVDGAPIAAVALIDKLYARRNYEPAWTDPALVKQLFDQVLRSVDHGLNPEDFHAKLLGMRLNPGARSDDPPYSEPTPRSSALMPSPGSQSPCTSASSTPRPRPGVELQPQDRPAGSPGVLQHGSRDQDCGAHASHLGPQNQTLSVVSDRL